MDYRISPEVASFLSNLLPGCDVGQIEDYVNFKKKEVIKIVMRRIHAGFCPLCKKVHDSENQWIELDKDASNRAWLKCPRAAIYTKAYHGGAMKALPIATYRLIATEEEEYEEPWHVEDPADFPRLMEWLSTRKPGTIGGTKALDGKSLEFVLGPKTGKLLTRFVTTFPSIQTIIMQPVIKA